VSYYYDKNYKKSNCLLPRMIRCLPQSQRHNQAE
jgi:hypothetical protein